MIQIKIVDAEHEEDCMDEINDFLMTLDEDQFMSLHYSTSHYQSDEDQIFSFSVCLVYRIDE